MKLRTPYWCYLVVQVWCLTRLITWCLRLQRFSGWLEDFSMGLGFYFSRCATRRLERMKEVAK